jgi:hypothetical protein
MYGKIVQTKHYTICKVRTEEPERRREWQHTKGKKGEYEKSLFFLLFESFHLQSNVCLFESTFVKKKVFDWCECAGFFCWRREFATF